MGGFSRFVKNKMNNHANSPGKITGLGLAMAGADGLATYAINRSEDPEGNAGVDAMQAAGTAAAWLFAEPLMWGITAGQAAVGGAKLMYTESENNRRQKEELENHVRRDRTGQMGGELGGKFEDTQNAATMRQRQMDILRQHKMSTEAVLGSEARQLHR